MGYRLAVELFIFEYVQLIELKEGCIFLLYNLPIVLPKREAVHRENRELFQQYPTCWEVIVCLDIFLVDLIVKCGNSFTYCPLLFDCIV